MIRVTLHIQVDVFVVLRQGHAPPVEILGTQCVRVIDVGSVNHCRIIDVVELDNLQRQTRSALLDMIISYHFARFRPESSSRDNKLVNLSIGSPDNQARSNLDKCRIGVSRAFISVLSTNRRLSESGRDAAT